MKIIIFAGGHGTRLWPLSRKNSPKQFDKLINSKSTLRLAVDRVQPAYGWHNIYISTIEQYVGIVKDQIPEIPTSNIIAEPAKRDVAAGVGLALMTLQTQGVTEPIAILWSDHLMKRPADFRKALAAGEKLILENPNQIILVGEKPRHPEQNLGWIELGDKVETVNGFAIHKFKSFKYRPSLKLCKKFFKSSKYSWNLGYFITSPTFLEDQYKKHSPKLYKELRKIQAALGTSDEAKILKQIYPNIEEMSFDNAILEKLNTKQVIVIQTSIGWSDPGTLYALKEALQKSKTANVTKGKVYNLDSKDCLTFNAVPNQLLSTVGLEGIVVVNTKDALLVCHKDNVPRVKELVKKLEEEGLEKYI